MSSFSNQRAHFGHYQKCYCGTYNLELIKSALENVTALHFSWSPTADSKVWELKAGLPGWHFFTLFSKLKNCLSMDKTNQSSYSSSLLEIHATSLSHQTPHIFFLRPSLLELSVQYSVRRLVPLLLLVLPPAAACPQRCRRPDSLWKFSSAEAPAEFSCRCW